MLEPDFSQAVPKWPEDIRRLWREITITLFPLHDTAITEVLKQIRQVYTNGGAEFACFELSEHLILDFYLSRNNLDSIDFFAKFLAHRSVAEALPMVPVLKINPYTLKPSWGSSFTFDGEIAELLVNGGAYRKLDGSGREAKEIGRRFCDALFGDRYSDVVLYHTGFLWSEWFHDIARDHTWIGIDKRLRRLWILCVTDTD